MNWISEKITNGLANHGTIRAPYELCRPRLRTTTYSGTIVASNGTRNVASTNRMRYFLPGKRSRAKKYAPIVLNTSDSSTTAVETKNEFPRFRPKL